MAKEKIKLKKGKGKDKAAAKGGKKDKAAKGKKAKPEVANDPLQSCSYVRTQNGYLLDVTHDDGTTEQFVEHTHRRVMNRIRAFYKD